MALKITPKPKLDRKDKTVNLAIQGAMEAVLTESTWRELGYATDTFDWINGHPRLLRSCYFRDHDYPVHVEAALMHILERDPANLQVILGFGGIATWLKENRPHVFRYVAIEGVSAVKVPDAIKESLGRFRIDHPYPSKVAFLIMRFGKSKAHDNIVTGIKEALAPLGVDVVRADDKQYHDDLFPNVLTYIYGCGFGIAVFERIETEEFNPNVALEVGYMFALGKQVCLLKDKTLKTLHADLVGKLYKVFDPHDPVGTIPEELSKWLRDKGLQGSRLT